jgi:hypothetical protein
LALLDLGGYQPGKYTDEAVQLGNLLYLLLHESFIAGIIRDSSVPLNATRHRNIYVGKYKCEEAREMKVEERAILLLKSR